MRFTKVGGLVVALIAALALSACSSTGPGAACDDCALEEMAPAATAPFGNAASAAASGGQKASNQPTQTDPARINPHTTIGRGSGPTTSNTMQSDGRSQAGAPSVNQGLILPTRAEANSGAGVPPAVQELQEYVRDLRAQLAIAMSSGDAEARTALLAEIRGALNMMAEVSATSRSGTTHVYNLQGARVIQSVANGSKSGDAPGGAIDPEAAKAIAEPLAGAATEMMTAPGDVSVPESPAETPTPEGDG